MSGLQPIREYLRWWGDPRGAPLEEALVYAEYGDVERERAALLFATEAKKLPISPVLTQNRALVNLILGDSADLVQRRFTLGSGELPAMIVYIDHLVNKEQEIMLLDTLMVRLRSESFPTLPAELERYLRDRSVTSAEAGLLSTLDGMTSTILSGNTLLLVQGLPGGITLSTQGWSHRNPDEPTAEPVVRGPKEGFVETATVNLSLIRVRVSDPRLRVESYTIGERTATRVFLVYIGGVALPKVVDEVRKRLNRIRIDGLLESGYLEEMIEDTPWTPFPLVKVTERPDVVAGEMLEGKVALITNGTPHALIVPHTLVGSMQAAEDYYERWLMSSFIRMIRGIFLFIALLGPSIYIAVTTFHHEMIPSSLLLNLIAAREGVPYPAVVEAFLMEMSFEALREAGLRLPKPVGQSVSIVGGLVIGESAVRAGLVSPILVVVVALTGIASFTIPSFSMALSIRLLRFPMMILAGTFGFYGVTVGLLLIYIHLSGLRSFGVPYLSPIMPPTEDDLQDLLIRAPWWALRRRPEFMPTRGRVRQSKTNKPEAPKQ